ncbi:FkbM family methyltransferase [Nonomuraea bangladeshensis]|uniref:FkbM family methyltransferase n=1 Tax=Nonomuraea bangladeshensis TaxID=404385 RepID=UPI003C2BA9B0
MPAAASLLERDGLTWSVRAGSGDRVGPGPHEQDIWRLARSFGGTGAAFVDVGAHVGHFALRLAATFAKVIAIEPNPAALTTLRTNLRLNGIGNIDVQPVAAHDRTARLRLWDPYDVVAGPCTRTLDLDEPVTVPADCEVSLLHRGPDGYGAFLGDVDALPIDLITSRSEETVRLIKIDVEGHEGRTLAGASETIRRHQPAILIEMHDSMYGEQIKQEVVRQLSHHGYLWCEFSLYQRSKMTTSDMCPYIYAEPESIGRRQEFLDYAEQVNVDAASRWLTVP